MAHNRRGSDAVGIIIGIFRYFAEGRGGVPERRKAKHVSVQLDLTLSISILSYFFEGTVSIFSVCARYEVSPHDFVVSGPVGRDSRYDDPSLMW